MKKIHISVLFLLISCAVTGQDIPDISGLGVDLSSVSTRVTYRRWITYVSGFDLSVGPAAQYDDMLFDDFEYQAKYIYATEAKKLRRFYLTGLIKWKMVSDPEYKVNFPVYGVTVGKEWLFSEIQNHGLSVELGLQYGKKDYTVAFSDRIKTHWEFPLFINVGYRYYFK